MIDCPIGKIELSENEIEEITNKIKKENLNIEFNSDTLIYKIFNDGGINFSENDTCYDYDYYLVGFESFKQVVFLYMTYDEVKEYQYKKQNPYDILIDNFAIMSEKVKNLCLSESSSSELIEKMKLLEKWINVKNLDERLTKSIYEKQSNKNINSKKSKI